jgi:HPt (histidine-containing phosphotransfer) domain-containing protein
MQFFESAPAKLKALEARRGENDAGLLHRAAHVLKSSSAAVGTRVCQLIASSLKQSSIGSGAAHRAAGEHDSGMLPPGGRRVRA